MGWDVCHWRPDVSRQSAGITYDLIKSLAGNAFNAFAFWPVAAATIATIGLKEIAKEEEVETQEYEDEASPAESCMPNDSE